MTAAIASAKGLGPSATLRRGRFHIRYEVAFWVFFVITTGLWVVDRFTTNVWPRQSFSTDHFGNDKIDGLKDGPWGVKLYDIVARVSGRVSMATLNGLLFTMMHTLFNWLSERPQSFIDFSGWQEANERIHVCLAILTCALLIPHVWSPFFPVWFHGYAIEIVWPENPRSHLLLPVSEWIANCSTVSSKTQSICLMGGDDIGRLIGMTLMLGMLFPLTRLGWALKKNWMLCKWVHVIMAGLYTFDLMRRRSHPHAWVLNTPFIIAYIVDRVLAWYYYRVGVFEVVGSLQLDEDYSVVYWRMDSPPAHVGDLYFMKAAGAGGILERLHPFTCIANRTREYVPSDESVSPSWAHHAVVCDDEPLVTGVPATGVRWDVAAVVKVAQTAPRRCCGMSQTPLLASGRVGAVEVSGPYRSAYGVLSAIDDLPEHTVIVASGSGGGLVVDFANAVQAWEAALSRERSFIAENPDGGPMVTMLNKRKRVTVVYTTRSVALLQFVTDRLLRSELLDIDTTHVALTTEGAEFDAERGSIRNGALSAAPSPRGSDEGRSLSPTTFGFGAGAKRGSMFCLDADEAVRMSPRPAAAASAGPVHTHLGAAAAKNAARNLLSTTEAQSSSEEEEKAALLGQKVHSKGTLTSFTTSGGGSELAGLLAGGADSSGHSSTSGGGGGVAADASASALLPKRSSGGIAAGGSKHSAHPLVAPPQRRSMLKGSPQQPSGDAARSTRPAGRGSPVRWVNIGAKAQQPSPQLLLSSNAHERDSPVHAAACDPSSPAARSTRNDDTTDSEGEEGEMVGAKRTGTRAPPAPALDASNLLLGVGSTSAGTARALLLSPATPQRTPAAVVKTPSPASASLLLNPNPGGTPNVTKPLGGGHPRPRRSLLLTGANGSAFRTPPPAAARATTGGNNDDVSAKGAPAGVVVMQDFDEDPQAVRTPSPARRRGTRDASPAPSAPQSPRLTVGAPLHAASVVSLKTKRLQLYEILAQMPRGAHVFFCGSGTLHRIVTEACGKAGLVLHDSHEFDG